MDLFREPLTPLCSGETAAGIEMDELCVACEHGEHIACDGAGRCTCDLCVPYDLRLENRPENRLFPSERTSAIIIIIFVISFFAVWLFGGFAHAQILAPTVSWYETSTAGGTENSNTFGIPSQGSTNVFTRLYSMSCYNYDTANPKVVMIFDSATVPANTTVATRGMIPLAAAAAATQPSFNSMTVAQGGMTFYKGVTFAASTTGKQLTVDTTSGGNVHCIASYAP